MSTRFVAGFATLALLAAFGTAGAADRPTASQAWARATAPGVDVGAVYLTIDGGPQGDVLVAASTPRASMTHLHTVEDTGGVAQMRAVSGVEVPAGRRVLLAPKGTHVMLMGIGRPLVAGEKFPLMLRFEKSGEQTIQVVVRPAGADGPAPDPAR